MRSLPQAVVVLALLVLLGGSLVGCPGPASRPRNLLLITVDTLRADHLGAYDYSLRETSPRLDRLASEGVLFERALAAAPWTIASTATLLTGLEPFHHGFTFADKGPLAASASTAAEILEGHGYRTGALSANFLVSRLSGFDQGFQDFHVYPRHDAASMVRNALDWLGEKPQEPFFLYLHLFDPHDPYEDPSGFWREFDPRYTGPTTGDLAVYEKRFQAGEEIGLTARDIVHLIARYDGEIRHADLHIGRLLDALDDKGLASSTVVCVVSDHGEQFLDHAGLKHGSSVHQEELHVPWILRAEGEIAAGTRIGWPVRLSDVLPTCLSLLGLEADIAGMDGHDVLSGDRPPGEILFSQTQHGIVKTDGKVESPVEILTAVNRDKKLIHRQGETLLLPVDEGWRDGHEPVNDPEWTKKLLDGLLRWKAEGQKKVLPNKPYTREEIEAFKKQLEELGYLTGPPKKVEPPPPPAGETGHDAARQCPGCGAEAEVDAVKCAGCGKELPKPGKDGKGGP
jgi:arylsulfatase A-like enzyme